jgi:hypothetical protein
MAGSSLLSGTDRRTVIMTDHFWPRLTTFPPGGAVNDHHETKILDHVLSVREIPWNHGYEISISGPRVSAKYAHTFITLDFAKIAAHGFAHTKLLMACKCRGVPRWSIVLDP